MSSVPNSSPPENLKFAIPKKGRLHEKVVEMLKGAGIEFRRQPRLDVATAVGLPITLIFLSASDIAKFVGKGNVDLGITGQDMVQENEVSVESVLDLGFGKCKLCVQAPVVDKITDVKTLAGKRIVTSFPNLTKSFFKQYDDELGTSTSITYVSGSVEAACGLGLADAVVDLVETGTTMRVRVYTAYFRFPSIFVDALLDDHSNTENNSTYLYLIFMAGCWIGSCARHPWYRSYPNLKP